MFAGWSVLPVFEIPDLGWGESHPWQQRFSGSEDLGSAKGAAVGAAEGCSFVPIACKGVSVIYFVTCNHFWFTVCLTSSCVGFQQALTFISSLRGTC